MDGAESGTLYLRHGLCQPKFVPKFGASVRVVVPCGERHWQRKAVSGKPRPPGQRLAKRKARIEELVKFRFCPMTSECSTAHRVRRSDESPARASVGAVGSLSRTV